MTDDFIQTTKTDYGYEWAVTFYGAGCALRGFKAYKNKYDAYRAARQALAKLDMEINKETA
jgi:hypothetical protein